MTNISIANQQVGADNLVRIHGCQCDCEAESDAKYQTCTLVYLIHGLFAANTVTYEQRDKYISNRKVRI